MLLVFLIGHLVLKGSKTSHFIMKSYLIQKFNDTGEEVLDPKKTQPPTSEKKRPFFSFLIVSDCIVYPDPNFLIFFRVRVNHTIKHNGTK